METIEQTFVMIKPDGVERKLIGRIIQRFEDKNFTIKAIKSSVMSKELAEEHYHHLSEKPFFPSLVNFITSGPVVYLVIEGTQAVSVVRQMIGETNAIIASPGTIRGDFGLSNQANLVHASDSPENAVIEIKRFFDGKDLN